MERIICIIIYFMATELTFRSVMVRQLKTLRSHWQVNQKLHHLHYAGPADFVLKHGRWFLPRPLPNGMWKGAQRCCFANAVIAAFLFKLRYVEGYAIGQAGLAVHHAWNTNEQGDLLDCTWWNGAGRAYIGVAFNTGRAADACWSRDLTILDDYTHHWPVFQAPWTDEDWGKDWGTNEMLEVIEQSRNDYPGAVEKFLELAAKYGVAAPEAEKALIETRAGNHKKPAWLRR
jgi:hypothetical protein